MHSNMLFPFHHSFTPSIILSLSFLPSFFHSFYHSLFHCFHRSFTPSIIFSLFPSFSLFLIPSIILSFIPSIFLHPSHPPFSFSETSELTINTSKSLFFIITFSSSLLSQGRSPEVGLSRTVTAVLLVLGDKASRRKDVEIPR